jgi:hypothetical protein
MTATTPRNDLGQPIGFPVPGWCAPPRPPREPLVGHTCRLEPLDADRHGPELFEAHALAPDARSWTYLPCGPFESLQAYLEWMRPACAGDDPLFFTEGEAPRLLACAIDPDRQLGTPEMRVRVEREYGGAHFPTAMRGLGARHRTDWRGGSYPSGAAAAARGGSTAR